MIQFRDIGDYDIIVPEMLTQLVATPKMLRFKYLSVEAITWEYQWLYQTKVDERLCRLHYLEAKVYYICVHEIKMQDAESKGLRKYQSMKASAGSRSQYKVQSVQRGCRRLLDLGHFWSIVTKVTDLYMYYPFLYFTLLYTTISKKVVIVNSRYWNWKELWGWISTNNLLLNYHRLCKI